MFKGAVGKKNCENSLASRTAVAHNYDILLKEVFL